RGAGAPSLPRSRPRCIPPDRPKGWRRGLRGRQRVDGEPTRGEAWTDGRGGCSSPEQTHGLSSLTGEQPRPASSDIFAFFLPHTATHEGASLALSMLFRS